MGGEVYTVECGVQMSGECMMNMCNVNEHVWVCLLRPQ